TTEDWAAGWAADAPSVSSEARASLSRPDARHEGQMLDLLSRYLCRLALRGTLASSSAVYSSMVKPHFAQQSLIFSIGVVSSIYGRELGVVRRAQRPGGIFCGEDVCSTAVAAATLNWLKLSHVPLMG